MTVKAGRRADEPVVFIGAEPAQAPTNTTAMAIQKAQTVAAAQPVKVRVVEPYRVCLDGKPFVGGDQVTIPVDTANTWIKAGWVEPVSVSRKEKA